MITVRPLKAQDIVEWYGEPFDETVKGFAIESDELIGICGIMWHGPICEAFSEGKPEVFEHKKVIVKTAKLFRQLLSTITRPVIATPDEAIESAPRFLAYMGFVPSQEIEGLYIWRG